MKCLDHTINYVLICILNRPLWHTPFPQQVYPFKQCCLRKKPKKTTNCGSTLSLTFHRNKCWAKHWRLISSQQQQEMFHTQRHLKEHSPLVLELPHRNQVPDPGLWEERPDGLRHLPRRLTCQLHPREGEKIHTVWKEKRSNDPWDRHREVLWTTNRPTYLHKTRPQERREKVSLSPRLLLF